MIRWCPAPWAVQACWPAEQISHMIDYRIQIKRRRRGLHEGKRGEGRGPRSGELMGLCVKQCCRFRWRVYIHQDIRWRICRRDFFTFVHFQMRLQVAEQSKLLATQMTVMWLVTCNMTIIIIIIIIIINSNNSSSSSSDIVSSLCYHAMSSCLSAFSKDKAEWKRLYNSLQCYLYDCWPATFCNVSISSRLTWANVIPRHIQLNPRCTVSRHTRSPQQSGTDFSHCVY